MPHLCPGLRTSRDGILKTFEVTLLSIAFALVVGLLAIRHISRIRIINGSPPSTWKSQLRGIPLLVQIFYIYYALGKVSRSPTSWQR